MTSYTFLPTNAPATSADFTAYCLAISTALNAVGFDKTADTGQTSFSTSKDFPTIDDTFPYRETRAFTDGLSGTSPVTLNFYYGRGHTGLPGIRIQAGQNSDGAGNLTNPSSFFLLSPLQSNTTPTPCYFSSDGGRLQIITHLNKEDLGGSGRLCSLFSIERLRSTTGTPLSTGVHILGCSASDPFTGDGNLKDQINVPITGPFPLSPQRPMTPYPRSNPFTWGRNMPYCPIFPNMGGPGNQIVGALVYPAAAALANNGQRVSLKVYGSSHIYMCFNHVLCNGFLLNTPINGNTSYDFGVALQFE